MLSFFLSSLSKKHISNSSVTLFKAVQPLLFSLIPSFRFRRRWFSRWSRWFGWRWRFIQMEEKWFTIIIIIIIIIFFFFFFMSMQQIWISKSWLFWPFESIATSLPSLLSRDQLDHLSRFTDFITVYLFIKFPSATMYLSTWCWW